MQIAELQAMTVIQLRKLAKEHGVKLSAGIDKAGIVERVAAAVAGEEALPEAPAPAEAAEETPAEQESQPTEEAQPEASLSADVTSVAPVGYRPWNSDEQANRPAYRQAWQARSAINRETAPKPAWQRTPSPANRFGPQPRPYAQQEPVRPQPAQEQPRPAQQEAQRPQQNAPTLDGYRLGYRAAPQRQPYQGRNDYGQRNQGYSGYQNRGYQQNNYGGGYQPRNNNYQQRDGYQPREGYQSRDGYQPREYQQQGGYRGSYQPRSYPPQQSAEHYYNDNLYRLGRDQQFAEQMEAGQLPDMMQMAQMEEGGGILEVLPDGYGFLRGKTLLPGKKDIYVSMAQIRRYGLRTGDCVDGKVRVQTENDKFAAMMIVEKVNGSEAEENPDRLSFEQLVPVYPNKRIVLENEDEQSMPIRLMDLITPMGFGQRAMIVAPPDSERLLLLREISRAIKRNDPQAEVLMLLIDIAPEEVTEISEAVEAEVFASTFADAPETQTRVSETMLERAQRLVEKGSNVVILLDSLTKLTRAYQAALNQGGRPIANTVTPAALVRPKRFFGAARNTRDAGSLTVIATIATETGSRVDDIIFEEFKGTANMELVLCSHQMNDPMTPMIDLQLSGTKKDDMLLTEEQREALRSIRKVLGSTTNGEAVVQLIDMMKKTRCNADLLERLKDWIALWEKSGYLQK